MFVKANIPNAKLRLIKSKSHLSSLDLLTS